MSHIPASKMPHAKPHDDAIEEAHRDSAGHEIPAASDETAAKVPAAAFRESDVPAPVVATAPQAATPPASDAPAGVPPAGPGKRPAPGGGPLPYLAVAAVVAIAVGGIVAARSLGTSKPEPRPNGRRKSKGKRGSKHGSAD